MQASLCIILIRIIRFWIFTQFGATRIFWCALYLKRYFFEFCGPWECCVCSPSQGLSKHVDCRQMELSRTCNVCCVCLVLATISAIRLKDQAFSNASIRIKDQTFYPMLTLQSRVKRFQPMTQLDLRIKLFIEMRFQPMLSSSGTLRKNIPRK